MIEQLTWSERKSKASGWDFKVVDVHIGGTMSLALVRPKRAVIRVNVLRILSMSIVVSALITKRESFYFNLRQGNPSGKTVFIWWNVYSHRKEGGPCTVGEPALKWFTWAEGKIQDGHGTAAKVIMTLGRRWNPQPWKAWEIHVYKAHGTILKLLRTFSKHPF